MDSNDKTGFIKEQKCLNCGGTVIFVPEKGKLVCEFCDTEFAIQPKPSETSAANGANAADEEKGIKGFDFKEFYEGVASDEEKTLPIYYCKSCGAEVIAAYEEASLTCPYCTNKIVLSDKVSGKLRPNGIIPFSIPKNELKKHMDEFYKDKKLLPKNFFSENTMEKVTGVYVPFWLFSGAIGGKFYYSCKKVSSYVSGNYRVTETETYDVDRDGSVSYKDIPLDASDKIEDALMDSILPYDFSQVKDFDHQYLAGFAADRFDVPGKSLQMRAEKRMEQTAINHVSAALRKQYSDATYKRSILNASDVSVKYILLPVYTFKIKLGSKKYRFAVNGQTGKVVGELPVDKKVSRLYLVKRASIPAAIAAIYFILSYFFGWRI